MIKTVLLVIFTIILISIFIVMNVQLVQSKEWRVVFIEILKNDLGGLKKPIRSDTPFFRKIAKVDTNGIEPWKYMEYSVDDFVFYYYVVPTGSTIKVNAKDPRVNSVRIIVMTPDHREFKSAHHFDGAKLEGTITV